MSIHVSLAETWRICTLYCNTWKCLPYTQLCEVVNKTIKLLMLLFSCLPLMLFLSMSRVSEFVSMTSNTQTNNGHYDVIFCITQNNCITVLIVVPTFRVFLSVLFSHPSLRQRTGAPRKTLVLIALLPKSRVRGVWHCLLCHLNMSL